MRRWMEMYTDPSNTVWYYNRAQAGVNAGVFWHGMPGKQQMILWHNYAAMLYAKLAVYSPGANPDPPDNPDRDYQIIQNFVRYDSVLFTAIYPTLNLTLFNSTNTKPLGDWADPTRPTVHRH